ncbi:hypothetical protein BDV93DRAFT_559392 [Ceratobasidium sp. AG-I]|nr:hypothetical protein BDV93DRAFT_559392 [Ceratobasidium sp. AG-I]
MLVEDFNASVKIPANGLQSLERSEDRNAAILNHPIIRDTNGPLSFFPLHAPEHCSKNVPDEPIFNYATPSYASIIRSLIASSQPTENFMGLLAVAQLDTPN